MEASDRPVVVVGVDTAVGRATADRLAAAGEVVLEFVATDGDQDPAPPVLETVRRLGAAPRGLVVAATRLHWLQLRDATLDDWRTSLHANLVVPALVAAAMVPVLAAGGGGSVVIVGSIDGALANPQLPLYSVAKGGIAPLVHLLAAEGAPTVRANAIAIAGVLPATPVPDVQARARPVVEATPLGRLADADEVAGVAAFLLGDAASYVNGTVVTVDGGRTGLTPGTFRAGQP